MVSIRVLQTAYALSFVLYNLSRNPEKQEVLAQEIRSVLGDRTSVRSDDFEKLRYLKAVIKESFR